MGPTHEAVKMIAAAPSLVQVERGAAIIVEWAQRPPGSGGPLVKLQAKSHRYVDNVGML
jgi:hypothetical protein